MSLIGLLTATEKQVHLGRLHMRPIQWHLKNNWRVPESLEKVIPVPKSLHPHLRWWLEESNVLLGQPLHPLKHALQIFTDALNEGWGAHLDDHTARGTFLSREQVTHKPLRAKSGISSSKGVSNPGLQQDSVDSYRQHNSGCLYQQRGGDEVGVTVCPTVENPVLVHQTAGNPQGTSPQFVSPVPDPQAWAVDALSLSWEDLDPYAFPPAAILGKVLEKLQDYLCNRIILNAPGWPNMPWFWDLVAMSSQIPLCLPSIPNLVSQPFNQVLHRNLSNLNLHAWLLEPQQSRSKASLRQWQHELRLLKEDQPDLSMRLFLQVVPQ